MKKLLSIILAVAMIMSLFCVVPASATMIGTTGIYVFEDFEDGTSSVTPTSNGGNVEVVTADNGSSKALKHTFASTTSYPDLNVPSSSGIKNGFTTDMTMRGSVRYKLGTPLSSGAITLLTVNSDDVNYYSTWYIPNLTDTTNWYTAEFEISDFVEAADSLMFQLRIGTTGSAATQAADGGDVVIYLDDLQITREKATNKEINTFSQGSCDYIKNFSWSTGSRAIAADPFDANNTALKVTAASNGELYNYFYFQDKGNKVTYKVGDVITASVDILVTGMENEHDLSFRYYTVDTNEVNLSNASSSYVTTKYLGSNKGEWQTITWSFEVVAAGNGVLMPYIYLTDNTDTDTTDGNKKDMGYYDYYFDNLTITVSDRSGFIIPSATNLTATMAEDGTVTPSYTYAETAVAGVEAGTNASLLKVKRANGAVVASAVAGNALVVPEAYRNEALTLEVIPVSSTGTFGDAVVTAAVTTTPVVEPIVGINIEKTDDGKILVSTDTELTNAKLIFVTYGANRKMASVTPVNVTLAAQGKEEYEIPAGSTVAMLWLDMTTSCKPLTDAINLN